MTEFRVELDQLFRGPADLLLQLVKDEELDVKEVPLARVCEGFLRHLRGLSKSDLEDAADFLVIAATLMWLKSNSILPHETVDLEEELASKDDLLARLLEYRRFREAAQTLAVRADARALRFGRGCGGTAEERDAPYEIADLSSWSLLEVFARLMKETLFDQPHTVKGDTRPILDYAKEIVEKLVRVRRAGFSSLFEAVQGRNAVIGYFVALLELVKQGLVVVEQKEAFGEIELGLRDEGLTGLDLDLFGKRLGESAHG